MSLLRTVSGATCAVAMAFLAMSSADAQTVVVNDSFGDGITDSGALTAAGTAQLNWNVTSSNAGLDLDQAPGPVDFASGDSGRGIHAIFPAQTLEEFGDVLTLTFTYTTPDTIAFDNGAPSTNEDFRFGLFDTSGAIDPMTGVPFIDPTTCLLYTSPSPRDQRGYRMPSSA